MRLWLKDSERREDPPPLKTDDRKAFLVGTVLWAIGLIVVIVMQPALAESGQAWWLWACVAGLVVGALGLIYTAVKKRNAP